ncbi:MAG: hydroxymethylpyrimidine transporter substrate-binding protein [Proteobacteria bacterium]|jgi:NitT/TauT family transport system substrate-binding protein|nr:hydroxymethylpyrimidine transporter substrate-binding protein [Pseudomonadota bacterium]
MDKGRRGFLVASALAPLALAGACSVPVPLTRVGCILWIGYEPLFLARDLGRYDAGTLRLVEMPSNTANLMALATGELEAATLTLDEFLYAREGGLDLRAILVFDDSAGADVIMSRPGIERLEDIRGKRIGVEETAVGALMLAKSLEKAQLTPDEVVRVRVTGDRHVQAYVAGEVDVLVSWEPFATQLQAKGARRLVDSRQFSGLIVDVLVARADALERTPDAFRQLLAGYFQALDYLHASPDDAFRRMAPRMGVSPGEVRVAQQGIRVMDLAANRDWLGGARPGLESAAGNVVRIMVSSSLLKQVPALDGLADPRFLPGST